jgi:hypothetical protein
MLGSGFGTFQEWYLMAKCLVKEGIYKNETEFPKEIQIAGGGVNAFIYYNEKPLSWVKDNGKIATNISMYSVKEQINLLMRNEKFQRVFIESDNFDEVLLELSDLAVISQEAKRALRDRWENQ